MKKKLVFVLAMVVSLLVIAAPGDAKKPLEGEMTLYFNLAFDPTVEPTESPCSVVTWAGSVVLDGVTYPMAFFPTGSRDAGKAFHFEEDWKIYAPGTFEYSARGVFGPCPSDDDVVMSGHDVGVTSPNGTYRMNGSVDYSTSPFEMWEGRNTHMNGIATFSLIDPEVPESLAPEAAPGTFRLN